jgi:hypothetical protein
VGDALRTDAWGATSVQGTHGLPLARACGVGESAFYRIAECGLAPCASYGRGATAALAAAVTGL